MKIHLNQIPLDGLHIEGTEAHDILGLADEGIRTVEPVSYSLDLGLAGDGLFGTGTLDAVLDLECVTCLERFRYRLSVPDFAFQTELTGSEMVDLTPIVREDILLALPAHPHCDWDGRKECKGARTATFGTSGDGGEAGSEQGDPKAWDALDQLNIQKEK